MGTMERGPRLRSSPRGLARTPHPPAPLRSRIRASGHLAFTPRRALTARQAGSSRAWIEVADRRRRALSGSASAGRRRRCARARPPVWVPAMRRADEGEGEGEGVWIKGLEPSTFTLATLEGQADASLLGHAAARSRGLRFLAAVERLAAGLRFLGLKAVESSLASSARLLWCR